MLKINFIKICNNKKNTIVNINFIINIVINSQKLLIDINLIEILFLSIIKYLLMIIYHHQKRNIKNVLLVKLKLLLIDKCLMNKEDLQDKLLKKLMIITLFSYSIILSSSNLSSNVLSIRKVKKSQIKLNLILGR